MPENVTQELAAAQDEKTNARTDVLHNRLGMALTEHVVSNLTSHKESAKERGDKDAEKHWAELLKPVDKPKRRAAARKPKESTPNTPE